MKKTARQQSVRLMCPSSLGVENPFTRRVNLLVRLYAPSQRSQLCQKTLPNGFWCGASSRFRCVFTSGSRDDTRKFQIFRGTPNLITPYFTYDLGTLKSTPKDVAVVV